MFINPARQAALARAPPTPTPPSSAARPAKKGRKYERKVMEEEELEMKWQAHRAKVFSHTALGSIVPPSYLPPSIRPPPPLTVPPAANGKYLSEAQHLSLYHLLSYPPNSLPPPSPSFLTLLSSELSTFTQSITPPPSDVTSKAEVLDRIRAAIRPLWGEEADVIPFGSFCTGLSLPHSDVDVALRLPHSTPRSVAGDLRDVQTAITCQPFERLPTFKLLSRARIPILRYVDEDRGVKVDLCVNRDDGVRAVAVMREYGERYRAVRPLVLALKMMLKRVGLSEVYSGGINSYTLQLMAIFFLQVYYMAEGKPEGGGGSAEGEGKGKGEGEQQGDATELGRLFFSFLDFYGNRFDYVNYGIMLGPLPSEEQPDPPSCSYFSKMERGWVDVEHPALLSIEDPCDATHDVASSSFGIGRVQRCFSLAHERLCMMSAEWEHTGQIKPLVDPTSDGDQQGKVEEHKEPQLNPEQTQQTEAEDDGPAKEKDAKKRKKGEKAAKDDSSSASSSSDDDSGGVAFALLSPLERKARRDDLRMQIGPVLSVLFTRQLYLTQLLIDYEDDRAKEKVGGKAAPLDAKALKKAAKRERRRLSGKVVPDEADVKQRDGSKLTKKERKARKRAKKLQRVAEQQQKAGEASHACSSGEGGEEAQAATQSSAGDGKREKKRRRAKAEVAVDEAKEEAMTDEQGQQDKSSRMRRREGEKVEANAEGRQGEGPTQTAAAAESAEVSLERKERKKKKEKRGRDKANVNVDEEQVE